MRIDQVLKRPLITEKTLSLAAMGKFTFQVDDRATKLEIAKAIEQAFGVHVKEVRTARLKGKSRRVGKKRKVAMTAVKVKAFAKLAQGEKIDLFAIGGGEEEKK
ncbi:MAG: 50S ribosomal protein L23 [bacterium]|nr:50S ribosomal protein L23 [bacterium]